eukprot:Rhum_TRINITY_DN1745_c0_g1::Rhum_TRINITY_DN1745_c0_g1_i1::g.4831::m.4831/K13719/OTU1, YOD1; ubiquitin thioesterase OTU1
MAEQLVGILGISQSQAAGLLEITGGNVQEAMNLYLSTQNSPAGGGAPNPAAATAAAPAPVPAPAMPSSSTPDAPAPVDAPVDAAPAAAAPAEPTPPSAGYEVKPGGKQIRVRVMSPSGQVDIAVDNHTPLGLFKETLHKEHGVEIEPAQIKIMCGFPPKALPNTPAATLAELGLVRSDKITVSKDEEVQMVQGHTNGRYIPPTDKNRSFTRREMPADNSCLFHACNYVLRGKERGSAVEARAQIAEIVRGNPATYNTVFLEQPNESYARWIQNKDVWGGAIELSIMSALHKVEICALDVQTKRMYRYGEAEDYTCRAFVLYSGRHYDAMALAEYGGAPDAKDQVLFNKTDQTVFKKAQDFIDGEHAKFLSNAN